VLGRATGLLAAACFRFALLRSGYYVECDRHKARKAKLLRGCGRKINDPTFVKRSAIINPYRDCSAISQIGNADECPKT
jgi:hypothetical protein